LGFDFKSIYPYFRGEVAFRLKTNFFIYTLKGIVSVGVCFL
jgi:hypothetical protein